MFSLKLFLSTCVRTELIKMLLQQTQKFDSPEILIELLNLIY